MPTKEQIQSMSFNELAGVICDAMTAYVDAGLSFFGNPARRRDRIVERIARIIAQTPQSPTEFLREVYRSTSKENKDSFHFLLARQLKVCFKDDAESIPGAAIAGMREILGLDENTPNALASANSRAQPSGEAPLNTEDLELVLSDDDDLCVDTFMHGLAATQHNKWLMLLCHRREIDPFILTVKGETLLHRAVRAAQQNNIKSLCQLGFAPLQPSVRRDFSTSPLFMATNRNQVVTMLANTDQILPKNVGKASLPINDGHKSTLLHAVAKLPTTSKQVLPLSKMLLQQGANLRTEDSEGDTPLHVAIRHGHLGVSDIVFKLN